MISRISGIAYGTVFTSRRTEFECLKQIQADGQVDAPFVQSSSSFIPSINDPRVESFLKNGSAPDASWNAHELGGFDSQAQSLFVEDGRVVLRSQIEEKGKLVRHRIEAPYDQSSGKVDLESSSEGFDIQALDPHKTLTFEIPGGANLEVHEDLESFVSSALKGS
ncbi:MAG: hypothetical protein KC910_10465 [Candidatus Eremiobacteraeota bacterium]|nr:hypothetical protein [Candidatus Eremiobacteraeota bacterium]